MENTVHIEVQEELFRWLIEGKTVTLEQSDGSKITCSLAIDLDQIKQIVSEATKNS